MRKRSVVFAVSSLALAGVAGPALAQDAMAVTPAVVNAPSARPQVAGASQLPGGAAAQPTTDKPGVVIGITLGELFTDNLKLARDGEPKDSSFITVVQPFVKAAYKGRRLTGVLDYTLSGYLYAGHSDYNQLAQHLNTHATFTVLPQHLFVAGAASYGREIIDNERPSGSGSFFIGNNRANVATAMIHPYWVQDLDHIATMTLGYTEGRVVYNRNGIKGGSGDPLHGIPNYTSYGINFSLVSPKDQVFGWGLSYTGQRLKADTGAQALRFARAKIELSLGIGMHSRLLGDFGKENRYLPDGTVDTLGATFWDVGYAWADARNTFTVKGGHRFYGRSAELSWTHRASRLTTNVAYTEQPTDLNQQLLHSPSAAAFQTTGNASGIPSLLERRVYLMKRASASADYLTANGAITLGMYNESRDYFLRGAGHETVSDLHLAWRFDLGPSTTLTPTVGWQRYRFVDQRINYTRYAQLEYVHKAYDGDFLSVRLRHSSRNVNAVNAAASGYQVNVVYVSWTHLFGHS